MKKLNFSGFAHWIVPALVVVVIGGIGTYLVVGSHANVPSVNGGGGSNTLTVTYCKNPYNANKDLGACLNVLGGNVIVTSTGKGGEYVKTDIRNGFVSSGHQQINVSNANYLYVKNGTWKVCDDQRLQTDPCEVIAARYRKLDLCKDILIEKTNGDSPSHGFCAVGDGYVRQM